MIIPKKFWWLAANSSGSVPEGALLEDDGITLLYEDDETTILTEDI